MMGDPMPIGFTGTIGESGLHIGIDGFNFGNVAGDGYKFAGEGGQATLNPVIRYDHVLGKLTLTGQLSDKFEFSDPFGMIFGLGLQGAFQASNALSAGLYFLLGAPIGEKYENADPALEFAPWVNYAHTLGFGKIYAKLDLGFYVPGEKQFILGTGSEDHLTVGVNTNMGLYGFVRPHLVLLNMFDGENAEEYDVLTNIDIRLGFAKNAIDFWVTFGIPTGTDDHASSIKYVGMTINPRFSYLIMPKLKAYVDFAIGNIGVEGGDVSFVPSIGVTYKVF
jgi:hypothetical protein